MIQLLATGFVHFAIAIVWIVFNTKKKERKILKSGIYSKWLTKTQSRLQMALKQRDNMNVADF